MAKLTVIDLTGKEEVQASGEGFLTRIIRRVVAGERIVGEVVEEKISQIVSYKAEIRDGLIVNHVEDKFKDVEQAIDVIKQWYQEEEDFIKYNSADPTNYQDVMKEVGASQDDFLNNTIVRTEIVKIKDKYMQIEVLNKSIELAKSDIEFFSTDEFEGIPEDNIKIAEIDIINSTSEIKRHEEDINASKVKIKESLNR